MFLFNTNDWLINGLLEGKKSCINFLYREYFPMVRSIVSPQNGSLEDAQDIFHDGLIVIFNRLKNKRFTLNSSLKTYLFSVCKNIWMRRLERKYRLLYGTDTFVSEAKESYCQEAEEEADAEKYRLFKKHLLEMPEFCRALLTHYIHRTPLEEIARIMNYKDAEYVKARKYYCKNLLRKKIMSDPDCKPFMNYE